MYDGEEWCSENQPNVRVYVSLDGVLKAYDYISRLYLNKTYSIEFKLLDLYIINYIYN